MTADHVPQYETQPELAENVARQLLAYRNASDAGLPTTLLLGLLRNALTALAPWEAQFEETGS